MKKARDIFRKLINLISKPEMRILPGQLAFFLFMSIVPMIALVGTIAIKLNIPTSLLTVTIKETVPSKFASILTSMISGEGLNFNIAIFFVSAFFLASNGTHSMIVTANEIYKIKQHGYLSTRAKAIIMIFILELIIVFLILVPIYGDTIFDILRTTELNQESVAFFYSLFKLLKYPIVLLILFINIKIIYIIAPDEKIPSKSTNKGALFTTIGWVLATEIYAFYVETFNRYDIFYGSVSNVLILLLWFYILSYIFVLGLGINASGYREEIIEEVKFKKIKK